MCSSVLIKVKKLAKIFVVDYLLTVAANAGISGDYGEIVI